MRTALLVLVACSPTLEQQHDDAPPPDVRVTGTLPAGFDLDRTLATLQPGQIEVVGSGTGDRLALVERIDAERAASVVAMGLPSCLDCGGVDCSVADPPTGLGRTIRVPLHFTADNGGDLVPYEVSTVSTMNFVGATPDIEGGGATWTSGSLDTDVSVDVALPLCAPFSYRFELVPTVAEAQDCLVDTWSDFSTCDFPACAAAGRQFRSREVLVYPTSGGADCPVLQEEVVCGADASCSCEDLPDASTCSRIDGCRWDGFTCSQFRIRCSILVTDTSCDAEPHCTWLFGECITNGGVCEWDDEVACTSQPACAWVDDSCRTTYGATSCADLADPLSCKFAELDDPCTWEEGASVCVTSPLDCALSDFSALSTCSDTCEEGRAERTRTVTQIPSASGVPCPAGAATSEIEACNATVTCD